MAQPWTPPEGGEGRAPDRPFDRQALQATLADALRLADEADRAGAATGPGADQRNGGPHDLAGSRPAGAPPAPGRLPSPLGGIVRPVTPAAPSEASALPRPAPNLLGGGLGAAGAGAGAGSGLRRPDQPDALSLGLGASGLSAGRAASGLAPAPVEQPTIALRRRAQSEERPARGAHVANADHAAPPVPPRPAPATATATPAGAAAPAQPRVAAPIQPWSPDDDDILPGGQAKHRPLRFKR